MRFQLPFLDKRALTAPLTFALATAVLTLSACPGETPEDSGVVDAGEPEPQDAGSPEQDAGDPEQDAGNPEQDAGQDAGTPEVDAGTDAGLPLDGGSPEQDSGPNGDEAGGLDDPLPVTLPFALTVDLAPGGDYDCFAVTVESAGVMTATTDGPNTCSSLDTRIRIYAAGETDVSQYLYDDDDDGPGPCSSLEEVLDAGDYVVCARAYSSTTSLLNIDVAISFEAYECGDGTIDPGEECDATPGCTATCLIDDGLGREDEFAGNDSPTAPGVKNLILDTPVRGQISTNVDEDWWVLTLPGGLDPGAAKITLQGLDLNSNACGPAAAIRGAFFSIDDFTNALSSSSAGAPCQVAVLAGLAGDVLFGNETIYVRVTTNGNATTSYTLTASFIEQDCGNGIREPSEECEPNDDTDPLTAFCSPATCRYFPPANDTCSTAESVVVTGDGATTTTLGVNHTASDRANPTCNTSPAASGGHDTFYTLVAPTTGRIAVDLIATGFSGVLSLHTGPCNLLAEVQCDLTSPRPSVEIDVTAGETYTVSVDSASSTGTYELRFGYLIPPANDDCANALDVTTDIAVIGTSASFSGDTRAAADGSVSDLTGCQVAAPGAGRDVSYSFVAAQTGRVLVDLEATGWDAVAYLTAGVCGATSGCGDGGTSFEAVVTAGETYTVVVDAEDVDVGPFTLTLTNIPVPVNDVCVNAEDIPLAPEGNTFSVDGDTSGALDDYLGTCSSATAADSRDTFYRFVAPVEGILELDLDSTFDSVLIAGTDCAFSTEVLCADGDSGALFMPIGAEAIIAVDGYNTGRGTYSLSGTFSPTPPNNLCVNPLDLSPPINGDIATATGTTTAASNDLTAECSTLVVDTNTRDAFYEVVAPADGSIILDIDSTFDSVLVVKTDCAAADELICEDDDRGAINVTSGTTYLVAVDAYSTGGGAYDVSTQFLGLGPNVTCAAASALTFVDDRIHVEGTTNGATDDVVPSCSPAGGTNTSDIFYSFVAPATANVVVTLDAFFPATLAVSSDCVETDDVACETRTTEGTQIVEFDAVEGEQYFIAIDGRAETEKGAFLLDLVIEIPPSNDTCATAIPLVGLEGSLVATLDLAGHTYDPAVLGGCTGFPALGPDVAYSVTLEPGDSIEVSMDAAASGNDEVLYLVDACPPIADSCVEGSDNTAAGETINYTYNGVAPKTFFIIVDEYGSFSTASAGTFDLEWTITRP